MNTAKSTPPKPTTFLVHWLSGNRMVARPVRADGPNAAVTKAVGQRASIAEVRDLMDGALSVAAFHTALGGESVMLGRVQWANQPNLALVHYPDVPQRDPFWVTPVWPGWATEPVEHFPLGRML